VNKTAPRQQPNRFASVRLTPAELSTFQQIAAQLHTTCSGLLRKMIRELIGQGPDLLGQDLRDMNQAAYQLGCVGRNLNQLLRLIYAGKAVAASDIPPLIQSLSERVERLGEEFGRVIDRSYQRWVIVEDPSEVKKELEALRAAGQHRS
jgi:hypothetical protein